MSVPSIPGYRDLEVLGTGGFAVVYRARQTAVDRAVAIKVLQSAIRDEETERRFARECNVVGSLSWHPHIAAVVDAGSDDTGRPFIVFELLEGGALGDRLAASGALDWQSAVRYMSQVSDATEAAHHHGVLHRDIKPDNILLDRLGRAKLADFGIAAMQDGHQTATGHVSATIAHASPEVLSGVRADERSDVYLMASTLFELLIGEPPFGNAAGEGLYAAIQRIATEPPPRLDERRGGLPAGLVALVDAGLAKDPAHRPQSAAAFGAALRGVQMSTGESPQSMPWIEQHHRHLLDAEALPPSSARQVATLAPDSAEAQVLGTPATVIEAFAPAATSRGETAAPPTASTAPQPPSTPRPAASTDTTTRRRLVVAALVGLLVLGGGGGAAAWFATRGETVDFSSTAAAPAGRSEPGFAATAMVDGDFDTAWMSLEGDSPDGDQLVFGFSHQVDLASITIHSGPGPDPSASLDGTRRITGALIRLNNDPQCELRVGGDQSACLQITDSTVDGTLVVPVAMNVTDVAVWVTSTGVGTRGVAIREVEFQGDVGAPVTRNG